MFKWKPIITLRWHAVAAVDHDGHVVAAVDRAAVLLAAACTAPRKTQRDAARVNSLFTLAH